MKTKIISTVGGLPIWDKAHIIESIKAGTSIFRMSSSFRFLQEEERIFSDIKSANKILNRNSLIMQDINNGVKKRLQTNNNNTVEKGDLISILNSKDPHINYITIDWAELPNICKIGGIINVGDGEVALKIEKIESDVIHCEVLNKGIIKIKKAITLEGITSTMSTINTINKSDISLGAGLRFDMVALSFVKGVQDINEFWEYVRKNHQNYCPKVIAKIETKDAIDNIEEIINSVDGIMIARGDLALQVNFTKLGVLQNRLIQVAKKHKKFCIVATQMFESIIERYVPSRAEILDISNAVYQGADALMLGPETCINSDGIRAINTMREIVCEVERDIETNRLIS
jgi:pyruvate kinase